MLKLLIFYTENKYVDENNATNIKSYIHIGGPFRANRVIYAHIEVYQWSVGSPGIDSRVYVCMYACNYVRQYVCMYAESMYAPLFSVSDQIAFLLQENALERIWFVLPLPGLLLLDELLPALLDGVVQLLSGQVRLGMCRIR